MPISTANAKYKVKFGSKRHSVVFMDEVIALADLQDDLN